MKTYRQVTTGIHGLYHITDNDGWEREITKITIKGFTKSGKSAICVLWKDKMRICEKQFRIQFVGKDAYIRLDKNSRWFIAEEM